MKVSKQLKDRFQRRTKEWKSIYYQAKMMKVLDIENMLYKYYLWGASDYQDIIQGKEAQDDNKRSNDR